MRPEQIGLLIGGIAFGLFMTMVIITMIVPPAGRRLRRYNEQRDALKAFFAKAPGTSLEVNWPDYGEIPKAEVIILGGKQSWTFTDDELTDSTWVLRFTKSR